MRRRGTGGKCRDRLSEMRGCRRSRVRSRVNDHDAREARGGKRVRRRCRR